MYPVNYEADFNPEPDRLTTFFRLILVIPWLIVGAFWGILLIFTHLFAWVSIVILGRYPQWLYEFNSGVVRFSIRTSAWAYLQTDAWPPFNLKDDPGYPIRVSIAPAAESQSRVKAFFRWVLVLPVALVLSYGTSYIQMAAGFVAWLTIVFRGYLPEGVHHMMTFVNGFHARVFGYAALLTDAYPPVGAEKAGQAGTSAPDPSPPAPQAA